MTLTVCSIEHDLFFILRLFLRNIKRSWSIANSTERSTLDWGGV